MQIVSELVFESSLVESESRRVSVPKSERNAQTTASRLQPIVDTRKASATKRERQSDQAGHYKHSDC